MMKQLSVLIRVILILFIAALIFHNFTARTALAAYLRWKLGVPVEIESAHVDFLGSQVTFKDMVIHNPGESEKLLARIPYFFADLDAGALTDGHLRFTKMELEISDLSLVRSRDSKLNFFALKPVGGVPSGKGVKIDHFILTLGKGRYSDHVSNRATKNDFYFGINRQDYLSIHTLQDVIEVVSYEALKRMGLGKLGDGVLDRIKHDLDS